MQLSRHHGFWVPLGKMNKQLKHYWVVNIGPETADSKI
jgi:aromatic ring-opening dioxygenase catalytic subunit (LigB family)